jgi:hypothetical protein
MHHRISITGTVVPNAWKIIAILSLPCRGGGSCSLGSIAIAISIAIVGDASRAINGASNGWYM